MLPLDVIKKYYLDLPDEDLKKIQTFVYLLSCGIMQHFHGENWDEYVDELGWKNEED